MLKRDPAWEALVDHVRRETVENMVDSNVVVSFVPPEDFYKGQTLSMGTVQYACELGLSILLGKPIVAVTLPGQELPGKLAEIADVVIEADIDTDEGKQILAAALAELAKQYRK